MTNQKGESVSTDFWGLPINFEKGEKVIITTAEVVGVIEDIAIDTANGSVYYGVSFPYGSVYVNEIIGYYADHAWITERALRRIKPKKSFLDRFFEEHKVFNEHVDFSKFNPGLFRKLDNVGK